MTAIKKFEIHLEHDIDEQYQYEPGETVRGDVILVNTEEIRVCSIQIQVRGEANVAWDDETNGGQFSAKEMYMDSIVDLPLTDEQSAGGGKGSRPTKTSTSGTESNVVTVARGEHTYPLEITLLSTLPSSFIGKYGSITYVLKATLREDKLMGLGTTITSEPFLVLRRLNIRDDTSLQVPSSVSLTKRSSGTCFCAYGGLKADFKINRIGHLPGDDIIIDAEIYNECQNNVKLITASLILNSTFHAQKRSREHSQVVNRKTDNCEIEYDDTRRWTAVRLPVPPYIPESRLDGCDMIDIAYEVQFTLDLDKDGGELKGSIPITIGTLHDERRKPGGRRRSTIPSVNNNVSSTNGISAIGDNPYELIGGAVEEDGEGDLDEIDEEDIEAFRHPMAPGEVRKNILFQDFGEMM